LNFLKDPLPATVAGFLLGEFKDQLQRSRLARTSAGGPDAAAASGLRSNKKVRLQVCLNREVQVLFR
jgi:hypothetical protein